MKQKGKANENDTAVGNYKKYKRNVHRGKLYADTGYGLCAEMCEGD